MHIFKVHLKMATMESICAQTGKNKSVKLSLRVGVKIQY